MIRRLFSHIFISKVLTMICDISNYFMLFYSCIVLNHQSIRININLEIFVSLTLVNRLFYRWRFHNARERLSSSASTITSHRLIIRYHPIEFAAEACASRDTWGRGGGHADFPPPPPHPRASTAMLAVTDAFDCGFFWGGCVNHNRAPLLQIKKS